MIKLVGSFASPNTDPRGLTFDGKHLWLGGETAPMTIYCLNRSGVVVDSFLAPVGVGGLAGLAFDGKNLWIADEINNRIHVVSRSGVLIGGFPHTTRPRSITFDGKNLWITDDNGLAVMYSRGGTLIGSFAVPVDTLGLTFDGKNLWMTNASTDLMYYYSRNGTFIESETVAAVETYPMDLAFDGKYIWMAGRDNDRIYQFQRV